MLNRTVCALTVLLTVFSLSFVAKGLDASEISAVSAVLYYPQGETVLFEKNSEKQMSMASTTKIMTSLLALEENTPYRQIVITDNMVNVEGTSSGLRAGDRITLVNLVKCMMLESGNDAANAVAVALGGSFEDFAVMMNERAKKIGMKNTSFVTPSGLDDENHYTTAYDMALLASEAIKDGQFLYVASKNSDKVTFEGSDKSLTLYNHNKLLGLYDGCVGIKTGFTKKSGRCLVSAATRNGVTLVAVTLNAGDDWNDHIKMLDYGFSRISSARADTDFSSYEIRVAGGEKSSVMPVSGECVLQFTQNDGADVTRNVYLTRILFAPVEKGTVVGFAEYTQDGKVIKKIPLTAAESIQAKKINKNKNIWDRLRSLFDSWWKNG